MLEITTGWKAEGRREGLLEGLGLAVKLRFPGSNPSLEGRLAACQDVEVLQEMLAQVERVATAAELDKWLAHRTSPGCT